MFSRNPWGPLSLDRSTPPLAGGVALADAQPQVQMRRQASAAARSRRRTLTIRHVTGHRIVALVEIVSPANKDSQKHLDDFVAKVVTALAQGIHLALVDLFPLGPFDPAGMDAAVWQALEESDEPYQLPADTPLTLASYVADSPEEAYAQHPAIGHTLRELPLFLTPDYYVHLPLESTYETAFRGMPEFWREVLEAPVPPGTTTRR